jgi:hypothetical protein
MKSKREGLFRRIAAAALWATVLIPASAIAGPPFRTDDPEPVDYKHWEFYTFTAGTHVQDDTSGVGPAFEFNYGLIPNGMLHVVVPTAFDSPSGGANQYGIGDVELGFKYRFIKQDKNGPRPSIGIFPFLELPTGDQDRGLEAGHALTCIGRARHYSRSPPCWRSCVSMFTALTPIMEAVLGVR